MRIKNHYKENQQWADEFGQQMEICKKVYNVCKFDTGDISKILIRKNVIKQIGKLMEKYDRIEWGAILYGYRHGKTIIINRIEEIDYDIQHEVYVSGLGDEENAIGFIHSHHYMSSHPSGVDLQNALNWDINIIVSYRGIVAYRMIEQYCGRVRPISLKVENEAEIMVKLKELNRKGDRLIWNSKNSQKNKYRQT